MSKILSMVNGNPLVLLWLALGAFALGVMSGSSGAWYLQSLRLGALQAEYDGFVATTKAAGEAARKEAAVKAESDRQLKESKDHEYKTTLAALRADNERLRHERTRASYVPAAPAGASRPDLACFDRAELDQALRRFDDGASQLVGAGDEAALSLTIAKSWAAEVEKRYRK